MTELQQIPAVHVSGLSKVYRDFWGRSRVHAVDGIDFDIPVGEIFGLLGPNGSGKSTTIKVLLGLLHATSGTVTVLGKLPRHVAVKQRIGYLPEESYLYQYLTPRETLDFYARIFSLEKGVRRERVDELLELVGLSDAADRPVGEFSKGMARRVGLAQALINDPSLIILDEPTSGLDPIGCRQVKDLMQGLAANGKTILLCSHLLADVEDVCNEIAILYQGRIRARGSVRGLLETDDRCQLTFPALSSQVLSDLLAQLRGELALEPEVSHPSRNLEQFFLETVTRASGRDIASAGATGAQGSLPPFLSHARTADDARVPDAKG